MAEAIQKTEIALQLPVINTVHFGTIWQPQYFQNLSTATLSSDSVTIPIRKLSNRTTEVQNDKHTPYLLDHNSDLIKKILELPHIVPMAVVP